MIMLKDFWYLYFVVEINNKSKKYFLNYSRARKYYHAQKNVNKAYFGRNIFKGERCMHMYLIGNT